MAEPHHHHHPSEVSDSQRLAAVLTHLGGLFTLFIVPAIVWFRTRHDPGESWLAHQAKEALNFQYTITAALAVCGMIGWTGTAIGFRIALVVLALDLVFVILALIRAGAGERFSYPMRIGFVR